MEIIAILYMSVVGFSAILSGVLLKRMKLEFKNLIRLVITATIIFLAGTILLSQLQCEKTKIVGINVPVIQRSV